MIALGFGMAGVFGLIVGVFSVWNGRMTRREISHLIMEVHRDLAKMDERTERQRQILAKMDERTERQSQILERIEETQKYVAELVRIEGEKTRTLISH